MMKYLHADVFSDKPLKGNGLTIFFADTTEEINKLQEIAKEFKQFETVFIYPKEKDYYPIRIFTVEEELEFAGHPILGASASVLLNINEKSQVIKFLINNRIIETKANAVKDYFTVLMNQGVPQYICELRKSNIEAIIAALNLSSSDISETLPIEVISTGLSYLLLPVKDEHSLSNTKIIKDGLEDLLKEINAKFVYIFNPDNFECRTWDNQGNVEDVATGSAAGPLCAYLVKNNIIQKGEKIGIHQGKYIGRPSVINAWMEQKTSEILIEGDVNFLVKGEIINL